MHKLLRRIGGRLVHGERAMLFSEWRRNAVAEGAAMRWG